MNFPFIETCEFLTFLIDISFHLTGIRCTDMEGKFLYRGGIFELRRYYLFSCNTKVLLLSTMEDNSKTSLFFQASSLINNYQWRGSILGVALFQSILFNSVPVTGSVQSDYKFTFM